MRENLKGLCLFKKHIKYLVVQRVNSAWNILYTLRNCLHKKFQCKIIKKLSYSTFRSFIILHNLYLNLYKRWGYVYTPYNDSINKVR